MEPRLRAPVRRGAITEKEEDDQGKGGPIKRETARAAGDLSDF